MKLTKELRKEARDFRYKKALEVVNKGKDATEEEIWFILSWIKMFGRRVF